jgi:hypothetical protein
MNANRGRVLLLGLFAVLSSVVSRADAAAIPVKLELNYLRCIQNYEVAIKDDDHVFLTVTGVSKGADVNRRVPPSAGMVANTKKAPVTDEKPLELWAGDLDNGEFALITVTLYQGQGGDPSMAFKKQVQEATKSAIGDKKTLTADEAKTISANVVKAQHAVVTKVKDTLARDKKTDHFGGMFNVLVWNDNGKIVKRVTPAGLTAGEHYGNDEKIYSKIKYTRNNVSIKDDTGQWFPQALPPISEDKKTIRVKMLETEYVNVEKDGKSRRTRNVTDYLADLKLYVNKEPATWTLGGENIGPTQLHMYWDFAE